MGGWGIGRQCNENCDPRILLITVVFLGVSGAIYSGIKIYREARNWVRFRKWIPLEAEIVSFSTTTLPVNSGADLVYLDHVMYEFQIGSKLYVSEQTHASGVKRRIVGNTLGQIRKQYDEGNSIDIWVDPENPEQSGQFIDTYALNYSLLFIFSIFIVFVAFKVDTLYGGHTMALF